VQASPDLALSLAGQLVDYAPELEKYINAQKIATSERNACKFEVSLTCTTIQDVKCGDGIVNQEWEQCDGSYDCNACRTITRVKGSECGNGIVEK